MPQHPDSARILEAIGLADRPGLYVDAVPARDGHPVILQAPEDPEDGETFVGLAVRNNGAWYLGCIGCVTEIGTSDAGMCDPCRRDTALAAEESRVAYEADWDDQD